MPLYHKAGLFNEVCILIWGEAFTYKEMKWRNFIKETISIIKHKIKCTLHFSTWHEFLCDFQNYSKMGIEGWSYMCPMNWKEIFKEKLCSYFPSGILEWWKLSLNQAYELQPQGL